MAKKIKKNFVLKKFFKKYQKLASIYIFFIPKFPEILSIILCSSNLQRKNWFKILVKSTFFAKSQYFGRNQNFG